ncbi:uncharacterized protein BKA55DRAFT_539063 [Fusarium redolens]|uniref:Uncharacterized protein n=1 Tax=Fusarium redolens TaxID=48865 RepID=A0A9P9HC66_FUSRE|nr:uncharacterized protein BKA55DRAFT_539063 [Fusarium redolens]KAH7254228.1 hypothetical protein BKA55DRAFT_539063 [Fusarium redolens]
MNQQVGSCTSPTTQFNVRQAFHNRGKFILEACDVSPPTVFVGSTPTWCPAAAARRQFPEQLTQRPSVTGVKRTRSGQSLSSPDSQCKRPGCHEPTSPSRSEGLPSNDDDEITGTNKKHPPQENSLSCNHLSLAQGMNLQQLLRERFSRWSNGVEYTTPPEDRLPPRKRFRTSQWQSGLPRLEEEDESEGEFVVISHSPRRVGFFHLACPFYIHAPDKHQQCLIQHDLVSIERLKKHLLRHHDRPLYCRTCRKTFATLIDRDNHALENACKRNDQETLDGLTESQKARLIKGDRYWLGEANRWRRIWSTVLPGTEQPPCPYLDRGDGLNVSMIRDFWAVDGQKIVSDFVESLESPTDEKSATHDMICQKALEGLVDWVIKQDSKSTILSFDR